MKIKKGSYEIVSEFHFDGKVQDLKSCLGLPKSLVLVFDEQVRPNGEIITLSAGDKLLVVLPLPC